MSLLLTQALSWVLANALASPSPGTTAPEPPSINNASPELTLEKVVETSRLDGNDWLVAAVIIVGSVVLAVASFRLLRGGLNRWLGHGFATVMVSRLAAYAIVVLGLVYALSYLGVRLGPLLGAIGLSGLVLALALQKVMENFFGGLILQARRPFTIGDTVELDSRVGKVLDIDARTVVIRELDGSTVRVPNGNALSATIVNLTRKPVRRTEIVVGVAYDTDLGFATEVIRSAVEGVDAVLSQPHPQVYLHEFGESSINFRVFLWHPSDIPAELEARHEAIAAIHQGLAANGITIAFPQLVVWTPRQSGASVESEPPGVPGGAYNESM